MAAIAEIDHGNLSFLFFFFFRSVMINAKSMCGVCGRE